MSNQNKYTHFVQYCRPKLAAWLFYNFNVLKTSSHFIGCFSKSAKP